MDCNTVRLLLEFARPRADELEPTEADALEAHLAGCPDCAAAAQNARQFDDALGKAMRDVPVASGLAAQLHTHLDAENAKLNKQRMYRAVSRVAAAAFILALTGVGYSYW